MDTTGVPGVDLAKVTPAVGGKSSPVWRLVIVIPTPVPPAAMTPQPNGDEPPDTDNPVVANRPTIERTAYFTSLQGGGMTWPAAGTPDGGKVCYFPSAANAIPTVVPPSGYAVVGSGDPQQSNRTFIGFEQNSLKGNPATTRMVTLNPADLVDARVVRNTGDARPSALVPHVLGIDMGQASGQGAAPQRLSISEPPIGYTSYETKGKGGAVYSPATGMYSITLDIPVDAWRDPILGGPETGIWSLLNTNTTVPAYRIIYLQRLADPTRPYSPDLPGDPGYSANPQQWNPYRTIDAMTVDLTTFNGVTTNIDPTSPANGQLHFEARQRGEKNYMPGNAPAAVGGVGEVDLWKQEPASKAKAGVGWIGGGAAPTGNQYFNLPLNQTLGYLNKPYGSPSNPPTTGDSQYPFPWLNFSYRPFNNVYELLLVPTVSSSKLLARNTVNPQALLPVRGRPDAGHDQWRTDAKRL